MKSLCYEHNNASLKLFMVCCTIMYCLVGGGPYRYSVWYLIPCQTTYNKMVLVCALVSRWQTLVHIMITLDQRFKIIRHFTYPTLKVEPTWWNSYSYFLLMLAGHFKMVSSYAMSCCLLQCPSFNKCWKLKHLETSKWSVQVM